MSAVRRLRNSWIPWIMAIVLACFSNAVAQTHYQVTDLGSLRNDTYSMVMSVNDEGWTEIMAGNIGGLGPNNLFGTLENGRAVLGIYGFLLDLGTLGGPNSWMNFGQINDFGQIVGYAETAVPDPNGEDICGFGTHLTCLPFIWQYHMSALPTLGGNNGEASAINEGGEIVGMAENGNVDPTCPPNTTNNRIQLPVVWKNGRAHALPTLGGDPDGFAFWLNDRGQVVGDSGTCGGATIHAVSWTNGIASQLPELGTGAIAENINNQGQIVGTVGSADGTTQYGSVWQNGVLTNLGLLPGDFGGSAFGNNSRGQVVGGNWNSNFYWSHAFIWQNGVMTDLNTLFPANSNLYATFAAKINERGQIGGQATVLRGPDQGNVHAFLATPVDGPIGLSVADVVPTPPGSNLPANVNKQPMPMPMSMSTFLLHAGH
jgi:probable HAF family extracellular repeat protein